ncbi:mycofactocin radical SAM maturase [Acidithrix ferrooxidans]|uniref:Mycofactocin maturase MftC n=1 Tax=Acidithrix ferrooxidans TaxID=1280514 RepID=A0A0D8HDK8_9ACTN|nr:mycofactocin radical SAM maturase [Acidithrix ferrooxidans]KJF15969.1 antilisterial bacteriocin subtilosin biosynthesis protein AlbA [Acidithrix ferrooxidans]
MASALNDILSKGLSSPICLTWELTYGCNLSCSHCLSDSGPKAPGELDTNQAKSLIDQFQEMSIFYINIGGGEPMMRRDFFEIIEYAQNSNIGVKFSTNGYYLTPAAAKRLATMNYVDVQISLDGHTSEVNDAIRGRGSFDKALEALSNLSDAGFLNPKISVVATAYNVDHLDEILALANSFGAGLRLTRLRPSGRGTQSYKELNPSTTQQQKLYGWLMNHREVLTGDSFFHLSPLGDPLEGLNMCGAGKVVCLIDPIGDVYACPFTIHPDFKAGSIKENSFQAIWSDAPLFSSLRSSNGPSSCQSCSAYSQCNGGCMATKFHTGGQIDDPDPDCVMGNGQAPTSNRISIRPRQKITINS